MLFNKLYEDCVIKYKQNKFDLFAIAYIGITISLLFLIKVIIFDQCYGFDSNDDANHTFVNLKAARDIMLSAQLPFINLYNNFGTPIMGDALTYPFSLQSITYWFFHDVLAMTINRAIIVFLTFICLFFFLKHFLSKFSASLCSILVLFSPGIFWNLAHHHYQLSVLSFTTILLLQINILNLKPVRFLLFIWLCYITFFLSVSIQLVIISLPFLILFLPFYFGLKSFKSFKLNFIALASSLIFVTPQLIIFFENIQQSLRVFWSPYSGILTKSREQFLSLFFPSGEWMHYGINGHFSINTYFSIFFIVFSFLGLITMIKHFKTKQKIIIISIFLGIIPTILAFLLQFYGTNLPFIKSVDSTRVWWFSNIFTVITIGFFIDSLKIKNFSFLYTSILFCVGLLLTFCFFNLNEYFPELKNISKLHKIVFLGTIVCVFTSMFITIPRDIPKMKFMFLTKISSEKFQKDLCFFQQFIISSVLILSLAPPIVNILGLNIKSCGPGNHFFSIKNKSGFEPITILKSMQPFTRMLTNAPPVSGHDLRGIHGNILGSNSRSIVSNQDLKALLLNNNLIKIDDNYFFNSPWQIEKINKLGIRYILSFFRSLELENKGWVNKINNVQNPDMYLYENPSKASIIYLSKKNELKFLTNFKLIGNGIKLKLPTITTSQDLVITFFKRKYWKVIIDGIQVIPKSDELGMLKVPVKKGDKVVILKYDYDMLYFYIFFLISILMIFITTIRLKTFQRRD